MLDLQEGRGPVRVLDDAAIEVVLRASRRIAIIGASSDPSRPSFSVFRYLVNQGFECVPVNPNERSVLGIASFRTLEEAMTETGPFDMVDVFRRSELCVPHAQEAVAAGARCLWLQLGVVNWEAARIAVGGRRQRAADTAAITLRVGEAVPIFLRWFQARSEKAARPIRVGADGRFAARDDRREGGRG